MTEAETPGSELDSVDQRLQSAWAGNERLSLQRVDRKLDALRSRPAPAPRFGVTTLAAVAIPVAAAAVVAVLVSNGFLFSSQVPSATGTSPTAMPPSPSAAASPQQSRPGAVPLSPGRALTFLDNLRMVSASTGWATYDDDGVPDRVMRTASGGRTWSEVTPTPRTGEPISAFFLDASHAWAVAPGANLAWATADGGASWTSARLPSAPNSTGASVTFVDAAHGWIALTGQPLSQFQSQSVTIYVTGDGGITWQQVARGVDGAAPASSGGLQAACGKRGLGFVDSQNGWLTGGCLGGVTFYATHDGGITWSEQALTGVAGEPVNYRLSSPACTSGPCILEPPSFSSAMVGTMLLDGYPIGTGGTFQLVYRTADGGKYWKVFKAPRGGIVQFVDALTGWDATAAAGGPTGADPTASLEVTSNGGQSWKPLYSRLHSTFVDLDFSDSHSGWALVSPPAPDLRRSLVATNDGGKTWHDLAPTYAPG